MKTMKRLITLGFGLLLLTPVVCADEEPQPFQWTRATLDRIASGDAARGRQVAADNKCKKCHGDTGISDDDDYPSIAGQPAAYAFKQLVDYRTRVRDERTMRKAVRKLGVQEMADLAAFYARQRPEARQGGVAVPGLVSRGDPARLLLPCGSCHGKKGEGYGFESPALAGQKGLHLREVLGAFQSGDRINDHFQRMRYVASKLSGQEIEQLARHYSAPPSKGSGKKNEEDEGDQE
jgi:cytochrome c553